MAFRRCLDTPAHTGIDRLLQPRSGAKSTHGCIYRSPRAEPGLAYTYNLARLWNGVWSPGTPEQCREMVFDLVRGDRFSCNRRCYTNPVDLEGSMGPVWLNFGRKSTVSDPPGLQTPPQSPLRYSSRHGSLLLLSLRLSSCVMSLPCALLCIRRGHEILYGHSQVFAVQYLKRFATTAERQEDPVGTVLTTAM